MQAAVATTEKAHSTHSTPEPSPTESKETASAELSETSAFSVYSSEISLGMTVSKQDSPKSSIAEDERSHQKDISTELDKQKKRLKIHKFLLKARNTHVVRLPKNLVITELDTSYAPSESESSDTSAISTDIARSPRSKKGVTNKKRDESHNTQKSESSDTGYLSSIYTDSAEPKPKTKRKRKS